MERKIDICGMQLDNLTLEETLQTVQGYFGRGRLYVVSYIYAELLKQLVQNEELRTSVMLASDMIIAGEKAVAQVMEEPCALSDEEIAKQAVANRILQYCTENRKTVYWVGETEKSYEIFRAYADKQFPQLQVVGAFATGQDEIIQVEEEMINDLNRVSPDLVVSKLPAPYQEQFIARQKLKLNGQVWLGLSSKAYLSTEPIPASSKIKAMIDKTLLRHVVNANKIDTEA